MAEQSEGCTCEWTAGSSIMPGTTRTPAASRITDPDCPVHGSDTDPSPDPVLSRVAAERDHYKQRVEELEAALELIAGHGSEPYRDPAGDIARLALLDQTDERKSEPFIPAVDTRDLVPASLLSEIADVATGCLTRASGELTEQQMVFFEPLQELLCDHSTPEEGKE